MTKRILLVAAFLLTATPEFGLAQEGSGSTTPPDVYLLPEGDAFALYDRGFGFLRQGDWQGAEQSFSEILQRYPQDELAPNARYWLAESYLRQGEAVRAARTFHEVYSEAPRATRAPDALYKEGVALKQAGDQYGACLTFRKLRQAFPEESRRYPADEFC